MLDKVADQVVKGMHAWRAQSLTPLETPLFRWLWLAAMASNFGAVIQMIGASWTMTTLDPSPHIVALVQTAAPAGFPFASGDTRHDIGHRKKWDCN